MNQHNLDRRRADAVIQQIQNVRKAIRRIEQLSSLCGQGCLSRAHRDAANIETELNRWCDHRSLWLKVKEMNKQCHEQKSRQSH